MGRTTIEQSHQIMAVLATNIDWNNLDFAKAGLQEVIIRDPKGAGRLFTNFLNNGCRMTLASGNDLLKLHDGNIVWAEVSDFSTKTLKDSDEFQYSGDMLSSPGSFQEVVVDKVRRGLVAARRGMSYELTAPAYASDIIPHLGRKYKFEDASRLCASIWQMIEEMERGKSPLTRTFNLVEDIELSNIFFFEDSVIELSYFPGDIAFWTARVVEKVKERCFPVGTRIFCCV